MNKSRRRLHLPRERVRAGADIGRLPPKEFGDEEYNFIKNLNTDVAIVVAYGKLIPKKI